MVSVIVPVYNAESYLGYCISSVLRQTYREIELILVNDGSKDNSLKICKNYEFLDKRIKILDIPNGGVGNARNIGLAEASGDYVMFVDSDDVIHEKAIETLYNSSKLYSKDLVKCAMTIVHLQDNHVCNTEQYTFNKIGNEVVYNRKNFLKNLMDIIWHTGLMEGPANGLYKLDVIKENNIKFPVTTQYGEDFLFNIDYFKYCNGAVLINEPLYYYIKINENSLSKKYIPNLFDNQIYIMKRLKRLLEETKIWKESNQVAFANYLICQTFNSIKNLFHIDANLNDNDIKKVLSNISNNQLVRESYLKTDYIPEGSKDMWEKMIAYDVFAFFESTKLCLDIIENKCKKSSYTLVNPGILNKIISICLKIILKLSNDSSRVRKLKLLIDDFGIKITFSRGVQWIKRKKISI